MKRSMRKWMFIPVAVVAVVGLSFGGGYLASRVSGDPVNQVQFNNGPGASAPLETGNAVPAFLSAQTDTEIARSFQDQFRAVAAETLPVVVEVNVATTVTQEVPANPFGFFFGNPRGSQGQQREYTQRGLGSGVIVARDSKTVYVVTNNHVAGNADEIEVVLNDGRSYEAKLVGGDELMDLALVSFETSDDVPIAALGDSNSLVVGDWVFAVGNPLGFQSTVTAGIVSAESRDAQPGSGMAGVTAYIQTDAAINQGNSGGALVNLDGEVVGINTWIASQNGGNIGLGFAIPINDARRAIADLISDGAVAYSWLGVHAGTAGPSLASDMGITDVDGAFVYGVYEDSPAGSAGLRPGDVILQVAETPIGDSSDLVRAIAGLDPGESASLGIVRDGERMNLVIRTTRRDEASGSDVSDLWPGLSVAPLTDDLKDQLSVASRTRGVVVAAVTPESGAANSGIRQGDVITAVNGTNIRSARDFYRAIDSSADDLQFRVMRGDTQVILGFVKPAA